MTSLASVTPPLRLPAVVYDGTLPYFIGLLGNYAGMAPLGQPLVLDLQSVKFYTPSAMAALVATIYSWHKQHLKIQFVNHQTAPAFAYWQRMDIFANCGISLTESFRRHDAAGRFIPLTRFCSTDNVDAAARNVAGCLFPDQAELCDPEQTGAFDFVEYATSELMLNVQQHAHSDGFILAQVYPNKNMVCLAIADFGIGIRRSFEVSQSPFWTPEMNDSDAIDFALRPKISSKTHLAGGWDMGRINAGVGLSMIEQLAHDTGGIFTLVSHAGFFQHNHNEHIEHPVALGLQVSFPGTLCAVQIPKTKLINNPQLLRSAKESLQLLDKTNQFGNLFEP